MVSILDAAAIHERLALELPRWSLVQGCIERTYRTSGWKATQLVVGAVGHLAELAWHHPELRVGYASVVVSLVTHDAGGVTAKDFALARKIEELLTWRPGDEDGAVLAGTPDDAPYLLDD